MLETAESSSAVARAVDIDMLQAALDLAEQSLRVFPVWRVHPDTFVCMCPTGVECPDPGKHPHVKRWQVLATDDTATLREWWATWPNANIGLVTGATNGLVVADFDPRNGGDKTLAELEALNGGPFRTVTALSGGGGVHLCFAVGPDSRLRNGRGIRPGLDRKGNGGYIVCCPSLHQSGHRYAWAPGLGLGTPMLSVPEWLNEPEIERGEPVEVPFVLPVNLGPRDLSRIDRYARRALDLEANAVRTAPKGTRNDRLNEAAFCLGTLVGGRALDHGLVESVLLGAAKAAGLGIREAQATTRSGITAGMKRPRAVPERTARPLESGATVKTPTPSNPGAPAGHEAVNDNDGLDDASRRPRYLLLPEAILRSMAPLGPRMATGLKTLDASTDGGIPLGSVAIFCGAPGTAKSGLAVHLVHQFEKLGAVCMYLAADEPARGILTRLGQIEGFEREALGAGEERGQRTRQEFADRVRDRGCNIVVIDPAFDEARTLEDVHAELVALAGDRPRVLVIDSLQRARCLAADLCNDPRAKVNAKLDLLREQANGGTLVILLSEMGRASYDIDAERNPLAAGKESGSVEYDADLQINLYSAKNQTGMIDVVVAKSRFSAEKPTFRLRLDFARASFSEVSAGDANGAPSTPGDRALVRAAAAQVRRELETEGLARQLAQLVLDLPNKGTMELRRLATAKLGWGISNFRRAEARLKAGLEGRRLVDASTHPNVCEWVLAVEANGHDGMAS
jgi:KaiC/GvpD/RAD55 family RecA-like ATPase